MLVMFSMTTSAADVLEVPAALAMAFLKEACFLSSNSATVIGSDNTMVTRSGMLLEGMATVAGVSFTQGPPLGPLYPLTHRQWSMPLLPVLP